MITGKTEDDTTKLERRNVALEAAIEDIRNAWAFYHSVCGVVSRDDLMRAINETEKAVAKVWKAKR